MKKEVFLFLLSLVVVVFSCKNNSTEQSEFNILPSKQGLNKEEVIFTWEHFGKIDTLQMSQLFSIYSERSYIKVFDTLLFFNNNKDENSLLITNFKGDTIKSIFAKGKGPDELLNITEFKFVSDSVMYFFDERASKVVFYKINDLLLKNHPKPFKTYNFGERNFMLYDMVDYNKFLGLDFLENERITVVDSLGKTIKKIADFNGLGEIDTNFMPFLYINSSFLRNIAAKSDNEKYILAYISCDVIEIYDSVGNQTFAGHGPDYYIIEDFDKELLKSDKIYFSQFDSSNVIAFGKIQTTDDYFFVSYKGKSYLEDPYGFRYILIFDWKGTPVKAFYLDKPFFSFYIDFNNKYLYTYSFNLENVYKAKLNF